MTIATFNDNSHGVTEICLLRDTPTTHVAGWLPIICSHAGSAGWDGGVGLVVGMAVGLALLSWRSGGTGWLVVIFVNILKIAGVEGEGAGGHRQHVKKVSTFPRENGAA